MNTVKTAIRTFLRYRLYTSINLVGLVLAFSFAVALLMYVQFEFSFDKFHQNKNQIYRVNEISTEPKSTGVFPSIRAPFGPALEAEIPEIQSSVRIKPSREELVYEAARIRFDKVLYTDTNFFEFFTFPLVTGNVSNVLADNEIVITEETARVLFGEQNAVGKSVEINHKLFQVSAIALTPPHNSHIQFDVVVPINTLINSPDSYVGWDGGMSAHTFVKVAAKADLKNIHTQFVPFLWSKVNKKNEGSGFFTEFKLEPLTKIHLFSNVDYDNFKRADIKSVSILLLISCIILLVAILNFIFIASGILSYREKEFQIKNYLGSGRLEVFRQLFVENVLQFYVAIILSLFLVLSFDSTICSLFGYSFNFLSGRILSTLFSLLAVCTLVSLLVSFLSSYRYSKNRVSASAVQMSNTGIRNKKLVSVSAVQIGLSMVLITAVIVTSKQLNYALNKDLGFTQENIIQITHGEIGQKREALMNEIGKLPAVKNVTASFGIPGLETTANGYRPEGGDQWYMYSALYADENFIDTYEIELKEGRNLYPGKPGENEPFLINQTLAKSLGWDNPIGKTIYRDGIHEVIGVVEDFHVGLIYSKIPPLIISKEMQSNFYSLSVAIQTENTKQTLANIEESWLKVMPGVPFEYSFFDEKFEQLYAGVQRTTNILLLFTAIAIIISMLGLFGISLMLVNGKTKEIGIRRVNGAKVSEILSMLNKDFIKWIAIAFIISSPIAWYAMNKWLENFAYKTTLSWWIFALAGVLALGIALLTVSWQSWRAATRNPVEALRYE
jgi:putative ABC transport system permease protein